MDKQTLLDKINKANITPELKTQLSEMVNDAPIVDKNFIDQLSAAIEAEAANLIDEIANSEVQAETDKYNAQMQEVSNDVDKFARDLNKKADEIDLAATRKTIAEA